LIERRVRERVCEGEGHAGDSPSRASGDVETTAAA
jgi:hypothetical protein